MSEDFDIVKIGDHFEIRGTSDSETNETEPQINAEVKLDNPHPKLKNLKVTGKSASADLTKIKNEAVEYLENLMMMGE